VGTPIGPGGGGFGGGLTAGTVGSVSPSADAVTLREHHTFAELPDGNYKPRFDDPRAGYGGLQYFDYSAPLGTPMTQRFLRATASRRSIPRHAISDAKKPITYYVDRGTPEPIRSALLEGARWWNQAFEAAGLSQCLPRRAAAGRRRPDGHPLQHDQLGASLDARLELRRHHLRSRDRRNHQGDGDARARCATARTTLIAEGLLSPLQDRQRDAGRAWPKTGHRAHPPARGHEGRPHARLGHEYYNSTKGRISVMDYPHPLEKLNADGTIDLVGRLRRRASATGTRSRSPTATPSSPRAPTRRRRCARSWTTRGSRTWFT
jgi:hypothetical protein